MPLAMKTQAIIRLTSEATQPPIPEYHLASHLKVPAPEMCPFLTLRNDHAVGKSERTWDRKIARIHSFQPKTSKSFRSDVQSLFSEWLELLPLLPPPLELSLLSGASVSTTLIGIEITWSPFFLAFEKESNFHGIA